MNRWFIFNLLVFVITLSSTIIDKCKDRVDVFNVLALIIMSIMVPMNWNRKENEE
jgi:hypothetical protein